MIAAAIYSVTMVLVLFFDLIYYTAGSKDPRGWKQKSWNENIGRLNVWQVNWQCLVQKHGVEALYYHSPVLTSTGFVNGRGQILTPTESTLLDRSPNNLLLVITSVAPTAVPNLVQIRPRGASGQMGEI